MQGPPQPADSIASSPPLRARRRRVPLLPLLLLLFALGDLRIELLLLLDHFTLTSLFSGAANHPLAVLVLLAQPSLWRQYRAA